MKGPKKTSLARKFIGIYLVLIASIVFVGVISFSHLSSIEKILSEDVIKKAEARYLCKNIILQSIYIFGQMEEYSYEQDPTRKRASKMIIYDTIRLIREYEAQIKRMTLTPAESKLLDRIDSILKNYYAQIDRIFSFFAINHRRPNADYPIIDEFNDTHALLVTKLLELEKNETVLMHEAQDNAKKTIRNFKIQIFIFCVAFTITAFALSLFRTRSVTRPINSLVSVLEKYGKGDTGVRARIDTWDEIGFLASRFNHMLEQIEIKSDELRKSNETLLEKNIELQKSEKQYRLLAENASDVIWTTDIYLNIRYISPSFEKISGYSLAEFRTMHLKEILTPESYSRIVAFYREQITMERKGKGNPDRKPDIILDLETKSGKTIPLETSLSYIRDKDGKAVELLGVTRDITERKKTEEKIIQQYNEIQRQYKDLESVNAEIHRAHADVLRASENFAREKERLSTTLKSITDGVITTDAKGDIEMMNSAAEAITGWRQVDASAKSIDQVLRIIEEKSGRLVSNPVHEIIKSGTMIEFAHDIVLIDRLNYRKNIEAAGAPIKDRDGHNYGAVFVVRDTTDKLKMEADILKAKKIESLGVFAGGIAHDFNNLLTAIIGNISLARMTASENESVAQILEDAEKVSLRARELTTQLLTFSRGGLPVKKLTSLHSLLTDTANFVLSGSNAKPEFHLPADLCNVEIDKIQISQVVHNLILNARQAMPEGGVIAISAENIELNEGDVVNLRKGNYVKITISDQGIGIPEENIQNIFDPYFTTKPLGSGLGLAITYSIVKKHEGHITVKSEQGKGTDIAVFLPASEKVCFDVQSPAPVAQVRGGRLLLMDDEEIVLDVTEKMLTKLGYTVTRAKTGEEAVLLYGAATQAREPFDIVIMDLTIPGGMGGKRAIEAIRKIDPSVKAVVSSGYSNDPVMANYREYGFSGVVVKPFRFDELAEVLSKL